MAGHDIASRLELLRQNLGIQLRLSDPAEESEENPDEISLNPEDGITEEAQDQPPTPSLKGMAGWVTVVPQLQHPASSQSAIEETAPPVPLDCSSFRYGEPADEDVEYCPWRVICTYPDFFIGKANKPRAQPYFDKILEGRVWDFFYLYDPEKQTDEPHLLVPTIQFESFLQSINRELGTSLRIPKGVNQDRFYIQFVDDGIPRPRYLKRSRDQKKLGIEEWPEIQQVDINVFQTATSQAQREWRQNLNKMTHRAGYQDKKKSAERRASQRKFDRERMLCEAQEYLYLKDTSNQGVVLICMDVEAIEVPPNPISEVGIAILDTRNIKGHPPGPCGENWWHLIESHHLRVKEYSGLRNYRFVHGCPDHYDFGSSAFPPAEELVPAIESILATYVNEDRQLVFVGHDANQDIKYLSSVGFDVRELGGMVGQLDTKTIHQAWRHSENGRGLHHVLDDLGIPNKNLHNAGNDAMFTLRALTGVAIEEAREKEAEARGEKYIPELLMDEPNS